MRMKKEFDCVEMKRQIQAERWHAIGVLDGRQMVTVLHTYRPEGPDEMIRIVSARRADKIIPRPPNPFPNSTLAAFALLPDPQTNTPVV